MVSVLASSAVDNNDDASFVPDQQAELDCDSGSSLIQPSVGRHVA
jgi:hypothetical protein